MRLSRRIAAASRSFDRVPQSYGESLSKFGFSAYWSFEAKILPAGHVTPSGILMKRSKKEKVLYFIRGLDAFGSSPFGFPQRYYSPQVREGDKLTDDFTMAGILITAQTRVNTRSSANP